MATVTRCCRSSGRSFSATLSGTEEAPIIVINYPGEEPDFDFEGQELGDHGFRLDTNYWHVIGLTIKNAGHNGFGLEGNHNRVERLVAAWTCQRAVRFASEAA